MRPNGVEQRNDQGFPQVVDEMSHVTQGNAQLFNTARLWGEHSTGERLLHEDREQGKAVNPNQTVLGEKHWSCLGWDSKPQSHMYVLMRDAEGRRGEASKVEQTTRQSNTAVTLSKEK